MSDQLSMLVTSKAFGPDGIGPRLLKLIAPAILIPLHAIFLASLTYSIYPECWKEAHIVPIFKKGDKSDPYKYRPVSLLNTTGKILERIVFKYVFNYFRDNFFAVRLAVRFFTWLLDGQSTY